MTCLSVDGDLASIGAVTTDAAANDVPAGFPFVMTVADSGSPSGADDRLNVFAGAPAGTCRDLLAVAAASPLITQGNLQVRS